MESRKSLCRHAARFALASLVLTSAAPAAFAVESFKGQILECSDTTWNSSGAGTCGGDTITNGEMMVLDDGKVRVIVDAMFGDPFTLYEAYWLPIGLSSGSATWVGNFATNCNGDYNAVLRDMDKPADITDTSKDTDISTLYGNYSAGLFLIYSRGYYAQDTDSDCVIDTWNVTGTGDFANPTPVLTGNVQFLTGYKMP